MLQEDKFKQIRETAEKILQNNPVQDQENFAEIEQLLHEVRVYQIELELQNEELQKAQIELELSRNQYSELYNFAPVGYFAFDNKGIIKNVNLTGCRQLQLEKSYLLNKPLLPYLVHGYQEKFFLHLRNAFQSSSKQICEIKLSNRDRVEFDVRLESIQSDGICNSVIIDISNEKKAERERIKKEKMNQAFGELTKMLMQSISLDRIAGLVLKHAKELTKSEYGYVGYIDSETGNLIAVAHSFRLPEKNSCAKDIVFEKFSPLWSWVLHNKKPVLINKTKEDSRSRNISEEGIALQRFLIVPALLENNLLGQIALADSKKEYTKEDQEILQSLAEIYVIALQRKKSEKILQKTIKTAQAADKLKSEFLANMSHEIRTPLNAILGFSEMLNEYDLDEIEQKEYLNVIINAGHHLLDLINDIIDLSKIEAGQVSIMDEPCMLDDLITNVCETFHIQIKEKKLKFHIDMPESPVGCIKMDKTRLRQILVNLLNNAVKFTEQGEIRLGYKIMEGGTLEFYIRDTGIGIEQSKQKIIFDRFTQADGSIERKYEGTGLGLAITKKIIGLIWQKYTGNKIEQIKLESTPGEGSCFHFSLPFVKENEKIQQKMEKIFPKIMGNDKVIIVAEDDKNSFKLLNSILTKQGYSVLHAETGNEVLHYIQAHSNINLIFMDMHMPEKSGYETTQRIRELEYKDLPIVAVTARAMQGDREKCLNVGCTDYVSKPIETRTILSMLKKYILSSEK